MRNKQNESFGAESQSKVERTIGILTENLKEMIDTRMIIGDRVTVGDVVVLPISKLAVGFVSGGGEYNKKTDAERNLPFAGGSGAGYSLSPVGFVVINGRDVKILKVEPSELAGKIVEVVPEVVEAINKYINKK